MGLSFYVCIYGALSSVRLPHVICHTRQPNVSVGTSTESSEEIIVGKNRFLDEDEILLKLNININNLTLLS